jgi:hypothetical protein
MNRPNTPPNWIFIVLILISSNVLLAQNSLTIQLVPRSHPGGYHISCTGGSDGSITSQVSGGQAPYTLSWNTGATTSVIDDLAAGTYILTIHDSNNDTLSETIELYEPAPINPGITTSNFHGFGISKQGETDGYINLSVSGGVGPFQVLWNTGSTEKLLDSLTAGTYSYQITGASNCSVSGQVTLTEPPALTGNVTVIKHSYCDNEFPSLAFAQASGGAPPYKIKWQNGLRGDTATNLDEGTQVVTIEDINGVTTDLEFEIIYFTAPHAKLITSQYANGYEVSCYNCFNGSIHAVLSDSSLAPYTFYWSDSTAATSSLTNLGPGVYTLQITDNTGCMVEKERTLSSPQRDDWTMSGNAGTNPETQFIGTSDETDVVFKTNNSESLRLASNQNIGVGTTSPTAKVDVAGDVRVRSNLKVDSLAFLPDSIGATYRILMVDNEGNVMRGPLSDPELGHISGTVYTECPDVKVSAEASWLNPRSAATNGANKDLVFTYAQIGIKTHCPNTDLDVRGTTYSEKIQLGNFDDASTQTLSVLGTSLLKSDSESLLTLDHTFTGPWNVACAIKLRNELSKAISVSMVTSNGSTNEETETIRFLADGQTRLGSTNSTNRTYQLELYPKADRNGLLVNVNNSLDGGFGIVSKVNAAHTKALVVTQTTDEFDAPTDEKFVVFGDGHVTIGTNGWFTSMLAVEGSIGCRGIKVLAQPNTLPDFVFQSNYKLPSIDSVANYINNECHLPGMSSALEVETAKEGVDLYTLQAQHLEQTERLYLYIIDLEKRLKKAEEELMTLKIKTQ